MRDDDGATIGVFLADDHSVVRAGLAAYLATEPGIRVVGEASSGTEVIQRLAVLEPAGDLPDVVLMDLLMPGMDGIETTREVKSRWPEVEVVAVTSFVEEDRIRGAIEAGAAGYLLKDVDADEVVAAIRAAVAGTVHLDPVAAKALTGLLRQRPPDPPPLSPRELDVLRLVAQGATNRQIARALGVTERTARTHVSNILGKLGLSSRTQAALWAVREGHVDVARERP